MFIIHHFWINRYICPRVQAVLWPIQVVLDGDKSIHNKRHSRNCWINNKIQTNKTHQFLLRMHIASSRKKKQVRSKLYIIKVAKDFIVDYINFLFFTYWLFIGQLHSIQSLKTSDKIWKDFNSPPHIYEQLTSHMIDIRLFLCLGRRDTYCCNLVDDSQFKSKCI